MVHQASGGDDEASRPSGESERSTGDNDGITETRQGGTSETHSRGTAPNTRASAPDTRRSALETPGSACNSRRAVLRRTGAVFGVAALGSLLGAGTASGTAVADDFEVWEVSGAEVYDLADGEVLENVLIDQTASGAVMTIRASNTNDWVVRNVGFRGMGNRTGGTNAFQFQVSTGADGTGHIENIWMNGKNPDGGRGTELGGIYVRASHAGRIDVRNTYIEGFGNNAVYGSAVGKDAGNEGVVTMENCYHRDNTSTQFRIGSPGSYVRNSVGVVDDPNGDRGPYPGSGDNLNARGIWGKHFRNQRFENCSFYVDPDDYDTGGVFEARFISNRSHGKEAVAKVVDCHVNPGAPRLTGSTSNARIDLTNLGEQPTVSVIENGGVPLSPRMAARGAREMPPELPGPNS